MVEDSPCPTVEPNRRQYGGSKDVIVQPGRDRGRRPDPGRGAGQAQEAHGVGEEEGPRQTGSRWASPSLRPEDAHVSES